MAKSYAELSNMAKRFGYRLAKAREGFKHGTVPVRYLLENKLGVMWFRSLGEIQRKLAALAKSRARDRGTEG